MADNKIQLLDTGKAEVGGSVIYTQANSGNWLDLSGFTLSGAFNGNKSNHVSFQEADDSNLTFMNNEMVAIQGPLFTLRGLIPASNTTTISTLISLHRSKGIKQLAGGMGLINALPEATGTNPKYINVIISRINFSEKYSTDKGNIDFVIELEQVK